MHSYCLRVTIFQVRKRPLNKKELAKNEEDIIETYSNSLTVHETKLKVSVIGISNQWFHCGIIVLKFEKWKMKLPKMTRVNLEIKYVAADVSDISKFF